MQHKFLNYLLCLLRLLDVVIILGEQAQKEEQPNSVGGERPRAPFEPCARYIIPTSYAGRGRRGAHGRSRSARGARRQRTLGNISRGLASSGSRGSRGRQMPMRRASRGAGIPAAERAPCRSGRQGSRSILPTRPRSVRDQLHGVARRTERALRFPRNPGRLAWAVRKRRSCRADRVGKRIAKHPSYSATEGQRVAPWGFQRSLAPVYNACMPELNNNALVPNSGQRVAPKIPRPLRHTTGSVPIG